MVCKVIKKINQDPGFDHALSFIFFQKWLDIVWSANDDSECILLQQEINYLDWKFQWLSAWNNWRIQQKASIGKAAVPVLEMIENKWKAEDGLQWWSLGDRWIPMFHNIAPSINFWLHGYRLNNIAVYFKFYSEIICCSLKIWTCLTMVVVEFVLQLLIFPMNNTTG